MQVFRWINEISKTPSSLNADLLSLREITSVQLMYLNYGGMGNPTTSNWDFESVPAFQALNM